MSPFWLLAAFGLGWLLGGLAMHFSCNGCGSWTSSKKGGEAK